MNGFSFVLCKCKNTFLIILTSSLFSSIHKVNFKPPFKPSPPASTAFTFSLSLSLHAPFCPQSQVVIIPSPHCTLSHLNSYDLLSQLLFCHFLYNSISAMKAGSLSDRHLDMHIWNSVFAHSHTRFCNLRAICGNFKVAVKRMSVVYNGLLHYLVSLFI